MDFNISTTRQVTLLLWRWTQLIDVLEHSYEEISPFIQANNEFKLFKIIQNSNNLKSLTTNKHNRYLNTYLPFFSNYSNLPIFSNIHPQRIISSMIVRLTVSKWTLWFRLVAHQIKCPSCFTSGHQNIFQMQQLNNHFFNTTSVICKISQLT